MCKFTPPKVFLRRRVFVQLSVNLNSHYTAGRPTSEYSYLSDKCHVVMKKTSYICSRCSLSTGTLSKPMLALPSRARLLHSSARLLTPQPTISSQIRKLWPNEYPLFSRDITALVRRAKDLGDKLLQSSHPPTGEEVQQALKLIEFAAYKLSASTKQAPPSSKPVASKSISPSSQSFPQLNYDSSHGAGEGGGESDSLASDILSLDPQHKLQSRRSPPPATNTSTSTSPSAPNSPSTHLSALAFNLLAHPSIHITDDALSSYISTSTSLHALSRIPEAFDLYAHKSTRRARPIPADVASTALDAAISARKLTLALDMIHASFGQAAFGRSKFLRRALPGIVGLGCSPLAAYGIAQSLVPYAPAVSPVELTAYATLGVMTYVMAVSGIGYVAITTANDQMERVTWLPGMPLRERWLREEEREALDRVAIAWGFKDKRMYGMEEGEEWDLLREWCGRKGMLLDNPELLEHME